MEAYNIGAQKLGVPFQKNGNEEISLKENEYQILLKAGIPLDLFSSQDLKYDEVNQIYEVTPNSYPIIWLHIAKIGNKDFEWDIANIDTLSIGGYNLFCKK
eukprot:TRINITY_DN2154_c4_g1_i1.p1 TRINITY_DN2154_c4_g1~~TRINITY_DN2154_c4_g1_i1.p1  ORF type:complete len:101 (+),score=13.18 TRINITY_DN2154_c4_g1_i1:854-1156(+)